MTPEDIPKPDDDPAPVEGSFFLDGLTVSPEHAELHSEPLPEDTDEHRFIRELGRGGMGVVYEAVERQSGRRVAVKVISRATRLTEDALRRFEREARAAASLSHDNCVFLYGVHDVDGSPAISMEFIEGETLDDRITGKGTPKPEQAVQWTIEILHGLEAVHAAGVIHRDIKPSNVFLTNDGRIKLGDFGLSRSAEPDLKLTMTGAFLGSPMYASPEQIRGRDVDSRTDIYSVGATLFALLAGASPFQATSLGDLFAQIVTEAPKSLRSLQSDIPRGLENVVLKALDKNPQKRFKDAAAFRRALAPFAPGALSPAGLGYRVGAYWIDSIFIVLLMIPGAIALQAADESRNININSFAFAMGAVAYFTFCEGRWGTTPGKKLFGLRVVDSRGHPAGFLRAFLRILVFKVPGILTPLAKGTWFRLGFELADFLPFVTMRPRNGFRGIHELASGTRTLETKPAFARVFRRTSLLDPERELPVGLPPAVGPFNPVGLVGETACGTLVQALDPQLGRSIWVHVARDVAARPKPVDHPAGRPVRWLRGADTPAPYDAWEDPGGASLDEYRANGRPVDWGTARAVLLELATLIEEGRPGLSHASLWIDREGRLRPLDFAISPTETGDAEELMAEVARTLFATSGDEDASLPEDLPEGAASVVRRALAGEISDQALDELRDDLAKLEARPRDLRRAVRVVQMAVTGLTLMIAVTLPLALIKTLDGTLLREFEDSMWAVWAMGFAAGVMALAAGFSALFRGGLGFTFFRIRVVNRFGHRASRRRCAWRAALTWAPALVILFAVWLALTAGLVNLARGSFIALFVVYCAGAVYAAVVPSRGLQDAAAGTHLVR